MAPERFGNGPLGDLRVIEVGGEVGEWCAKLMADLGADVIKIEPPGGAAEREIGPFLDDIPTAERSLHFWHYNTSKRGITLDLESVAGRELLRRLADTADVVLKSYPPGYLPSIGLGYRELEGSNPRLVMCSLTPFGQQGPWRDYRTSDLVHLAVGGQMGECGYDEVDVAAPLHRSAQAAGTRGTQRDTTPSSASCRRSSTAACRAPVSTSTPACTTPAR